MNKQNNNLNEAIKIFFEQRPSISVRSFEREANVPTSTIANFIKGERNLPGKHLIRIYELTVKYGNEEEI